MLDKMETQEKTISQLQREVREKDSKLEEVRCEIEALEERVNKQAQYSSNDTINIDNLPIYDVNLPLLGNVLKFFERFLDYRLQIGDIKACHLLPKTEEQSVLSVIVKFVSFHHKIDIYNSRMVLSRPNMLHATNKNLIFLRERLAKNDLKVKFYAEKDKNLVTTTFNSQVNVFVKNDIDETVSKVIQSKKDVDQIESVAIKRTRHKMNVNRFSSKNNVAQQFQKTFGKRSLQESPTAYKDKPISKIANTNQTPDDSKGM